MMGIGGASAADQTRLRRHELEMGFVALPAWLADRELAFFDFGGSSIGCLANKFCSPWFQLDLKLRSLDRNRGRE
jgi:hypothetical protein